MSKASHGRGKATSVSEKAKANARADEETKTQQDFFAFNRPFAYQKLRKHAMQIVIHPDEQMAADCVTKIMRRMKFQFHTGHIFTCSRRKHGARFFYECDSVDRMKQEPEILKDIYKRQAAQMNKDADLTVEQKEVMEMLDEPGRIRYAKRLQPLHMLPRRIFGQHIPMRVYKVINLYLLIPDAYLVLHHCVSSVSSRKIVNSDAQLFAKPHVRKCLVEMKRENQLTRIVTIPPECLLPTSYFAACDYLFLFAKDIEQLHAIYKRARLSQCFDSFEALLGLIQPFNDRQGLVIDMSPQDHGETDPADSRQLAPFDVNRVFWTTDIVHGRSNAA